MTNEENTLCAPIFLLSPAHTPHTSEVGRSLSTVQSQDLGQIVGARELGLDLTPGPGCAQPALDLALGRASLQLDGCVRRGLCPFGGQQEVV